MTCDNGVDSGGAEIKTALDRAERDLAGAESEVNRRVAELAAAEAAIAGAVRRGATMEEIAKAVESKLIARDDIRSAGQAFARATRAHSDAVREYERERLRQERKTFAEQWSAVVATLAADYDAAAETIVGAMASDRLIVEAVERASRRRDAPTLRTRGWLISPKFHERLILPRPLPLPDGRRPHFWHPSHPLDRLKDVTPSVHISIASLGLDAPLASPAEWDAIQRLINDAETQLFDLYTRTASSLAEKLGNEWLIRKNLDAAKNRYVAAGMRPPTLPSTWPATRPSIVPAVDAALPKLCSRDYHTVDASARSTPLHL